MDKKYYKQSNLIFADLLLAEVSKIQGDMEEYKKKLNYMRKI